MPKDKPEIRFAGYTDAWEERKLSDMANVKTGFPFKNENFVDDGQYLVITNGNIQNDSAFVDGKVGNRITAVTDEIKEKYTLNYGDILVTMDGTVGRTAKVVEGNQILAQRVGRLVSESTPEFIYQWLNTGKFFTEMTKVSHGGTIKHISLSEIGDYVAYVPTSKDEREKIGSLFLNIDKTITLHQRKLDLLKEQKKGYLQKMFPKNGEKVPELRFAGFADDWEKRKLGEITNISTGKLDANAMVDNGKYDFYTSGIKKYKINTPSFEGPAITIAGNGATVGYMHLADNKFNAYQRTYVLQNFLADRNFLFSEIGNKLPKKINQEARNGNIPYIVMDMLTELKLTLPISDTEQQMIGIFLKQLDNLITVNQRRVDLLKQEKKALLQKMFV